MHSLIRTPRRDDRGATAVEYAIMMAMIALAIFGTVQLLGTSVIDLFLIPIDEFNGA